MVQYKAGYKFTDGGVHAQVLDFPEAISCGSNLDEARRMLASALLDMAETRLELGEPLPRPDMSATNSLMACGSAATVMAHPSRLPESNCNSRFIRTSGLVTSWNPRSSYGATRGALVYECSAPRRGA